MKFPRKVSLQGGVAPIGSPHRRQRAANRWRAPCPSSSPNTSVPPLVAARAQGQRAPGWGPTKAVKPLTIAWDHSLSGWKNHLRAAQEFARVTGLVGHYQWVDIGESGYVFVRDNAIGEGFTVKTEDYLTLEEARELTNA
jgi:hypothetical protein